MYRCLAVTLFAFLYADTTARATGEDTIASPLPLTTSPLPSTLNTSAQTHCQQQLFKAWQRSYPPKAATKIPRRWPYAVRLQRDSLLARALCAPLDSVSNEMRYLYDMRLPLISSGSVPTAPPNALSALVAEQEKASMNTGLPRLTFTERLKQCDFYESERHYVRYLAAANDPRRFRFVRKSSFDILTTAGQRLDSLSVLETVRLDSPLDTTLQTDDLETLHDVLTLHPDRWHLKGDHTFSMQQTALTTNWYKGGDNNLTLSSEQKITFSRYDEDSKVTFETVLDLKLSGYYTKADTIHPMRVSDNELSATIKYGYKAWKKWYYSAQIYAKTPVFDYYKANVTTCQSTFLSPFENNVSLGVDYQYTSPNKKFSYSLLLAPLSYEFVWVANHRIDRSAYNIADGHTTHHAFGSTLTSKFEWKISDKAVWNSRFYYFTSYEALKLEFENTFDFTIGRFFTAKIYLYPRYDDSIDRKYEAKEMFALGFTYQW